MPASGSQPAPTTTRLTGIGNMNHNLFLLSASLAFRSLCEQARSFKGSFAADSFPRLQSSPSVAGLAADISYSLQFRVNLQGLHVLQGQLTTTCQLLCQRCFEPFCHELCARVCLCSDEDLARSLKLAERFEFIELDAEQHCSLHDFLEDSLILELPMIPRHSHNCLTEQSYSFTSPDDNQIPSGPFADLRNLLSARRQ